MMMRFFGWEFGLQEAQYVKSSKHLPRKTPKKSARYVIGLSAKRYIVPEISIYRIQQSTYIGKQETTQGSGQVLGILTDSIAIAMVGLQ